jgi:uncharacterized membrane protein
LQKNRLEAFSDGVIAILITIMVFELKAPKDADWDSLRPLVPPFLSFLLSFLNLAIYWNNHHHLMQLVKSVNGKLLWANMHLLFWLSLIPPTTQWVGSSVYARIPVISQGVVLLMCGVAYYLLQRSIASIPDNRGGVDAAIGADVKGWSSVAAYLAAVPLAFVDPKISVLVYAGVAVLWFVPDLRVERWLSENDPAQSEQP